MYYEHKKHGGDIVTNIELIRSTPKEKAQQIANAAAFVGAASAAKAVKTHSLGQISHALYDVGGEYRRNM